MLLTPLRRSRAAIGGNVAENAGRHSLFESMGLTVHNVLTDSNAVLANGDCVIFGSGDTLDSPPAMTCTSVAEWIGGFASNYY